MISFLILVLYNYCAISSSFRPTQPLRITRPFRIRMVADDSVSIIQKYSALFDKDSTTDIVQNINAGKLSELFISNDYKQIVGVDKMPNTDIIYSQFHLSNVNPVEISSIVNQALERNVPIHYIEFSYFAGVTKQLQQGFAIFGNILFNIGLPLLFVIILISNLRNMNQMNMFGQIGGSTNMINRNGRNSMARNLLVTPNVSLSSWAGSPEVLEECKEVVSYLDNKEFFSETGAEMPKGILLEGPPGTGKTLIAKGIATETNSTFISVSGSEFVELFVGMGAAKVRELFKTARENSPCIIFIDEIDAIGKQRGSSPSIGSNDEREQTLNQILFEMDGFQNNDGILILAATNRKDILDKALLRPGRFDRIIKVPLPDKYSRIKILEYYCSLKKIDPKIDITSFAEITDGFSGAELKNVINEAAILTARQKKTIIGEKELYNAFEKSIIGLVKNNNGASNNTKMRVAIHESGHAIVTLQYPEYFELQKVSIQATYGGAGGYTIFTEKSEIKEGGLYTRDILKKRLIIMLGGKAAENLYYGREFMSLGAIQDLKQANTLSQKMIGNFGMGDKLEVFFNENVNSENNGLFGNKYSEDTKRIMDKESLQLVTDAYNEAKTILRNNMDLLLDMSELLVNGTVLNKRDIPHYFLHKHNK